MAWSRHLRCTLPGAAAGVLAALIPAIWMWGFTVDDALIPVRFARHLAAGEGYRFNVGGQVTDGVTPLPWAFLLAPFARGDALDVLTRAKYMNLGAWLLAAAAWGLAVERAEAGRFAKIVAFLALAMSVPVAAYVVSGMETGIAIALATMASIQAARPLRAAAFAGLAASFRPDLAPWAITLALGFALADPARTRVRVAGAMGFALAPFLVCALARALVFGRVAPLAVLAKPSDLAHGTSYAVVASLVTAGPLLALAPLALRHAPRPAQVIVLSGLAHIGVVAAVGGDWMPFARLMTPVAPSLVYASVLAAPHARLWSLGVRAAAALGFELYIAVVAAPAGCHVMQDRAALIAAARPLLQNARIVAALDVGWVGAATEAEIVDLAGITDPTIAALPGGHTSKRVDPAFLLARDPDVLLVYSQPRLVESRLLDSEVIAARFERAASLPLGSRSYLVFARKR